jgi:hypothetical protein
MYTTDNTVQEVKVERSIGWTFKLNIASDAIPTPLLVRPSDDNPKHSLC